MLTIQVLGNPKSMDNLGLFQIDVDTYNQLFKNGKDLFFSCDFTPKMSWKMVKKKLIKVNPQQLNGIRGTIHLKDSTVSPDSFPRRRTEMDDPLSIKRNGTINLNNSFFQLLDGALNSTCDVYEVDSSVHKLIFPNGKQIIIGEEVPTFEDEFWTDIAYKKNVKKSSIPRLDGIIIL